MCILLFAFATASVKASDVPEGFSFNETGAGRYLLGEGNRTLYWNENESGTDEIVCVDKCTDVWIPVLASSGASSTANWMTVERPDGTVQWAYNGKPLYTSIRDTSPNARLGAGRSWNVFFEVKKPPAGMKVTDTLVGRVLADHTGRTLYANNGGEEATASNAESSRSWQPLEAPWLAQAQAQEDWSVVSNSNGTLQWAYNEKPLFTYAKDKEAGDLYGHLKDGQWSAVVLEAAPSLPSWVTVQRVEKGIVYADQQGMTIYGPLFPNSLDGVNACLEDCVEEFWRPILAEPGDQPTGLWAILTNENGEKQWAYNGRFLYRHLRDQKPGDINGDGFGIGYKLAGGWRVIYVESGLRPTLQ